MSEETWSGYGTVVVEKDGGEMCMLIAPEGPRRLAWSCVVLSDNDGKTRFPVGVLMSGFYFFKKYWDRVE